MVRKCLIKRKRKEALDKATKAKDKKEDKKDK